MHLSILIAAALSVVSSVLASSILEARQCIGPNVNKATLALIKEFEGFVPRPEPDPIGLPTVGYGHLCKTKGCKEVKFPLSKGTATTLLKKDLRSFQQAITLSTKTAVKLNANQYGALVSWAYNVGPNAARSSSLISRLNKGEDPNKVIAQELPKWRLAGGKVFKGLVRRRKAEVKLAKTPTKSKALPALHMYVHYMHNLRKICVLNARQVKWRELVNPATTRCFMQSSSLSLLGLSIQGKMLFFDKYQQGVEQMADVSRKAYLLILSGRTLMVQKTLQALASQTCNMPNHPIVVVYLHLGPGRSTPGQGLFKDGKKVSHKDVTWFGAFGARFQTYPSNTVPSLNGAERG
ncbi:conserved hypothetical protein [Histoplasma capsulatum H143]|uniref:Lysozyme n=1 Tax=Ajellomyces capsulatus (strain H143) TaxID=544712 RepID=C6H5Y9_AJECH|nr:conserved hypothetical protein [Histoplasma capsulatum H143]